MGCEDISLTNRTLENAEKIKEIFKEIKMSDFKSRNCIYDESQNQLVFSDSDEIIRDDSNVTASVSTTLATSKNNEDFKKKNRERAKAHYQNGYKEKKKEKYNENKDLLKNKSLFNYYKKQDKIDIFKTKHEDKYKMLVDKGFIQ